MTGAAVAERHLTLVHDESKRAKALRRFNRDDQIFKAVTLTSALTVLVLLAGVMVALLHGSLPAWRAFGFGFFTSESWNPVTEKFGALPAIYGTLLTSFIAMLIGVPISLGIAIFLTEICPERLGGASASPSSCSPASPASSTASGACSCSRLRSRPTCSRC